MAVALARVAAGEPDPACTVLLDGSTPCGGILKSATISFGQQLVAADLQRAETAALRCDLLVCVGSTLGVYPAAGMVPLAARSGAPIVIVNRDPTPFDDLAAVVLRRPISESLPAVLGARGGPEER
jgi:NAD-dependent deacetylase